MRDAALVCCDKCALCACVCNSLYVCVAVGYCMCNCFRSALLQEGVVDWYMCKRGTSANVEHCRNEALEVWNAAGKGFCKWKLLSLRAGLGLYLNRCGTFITNVTLTFTWKHQHILRLLGNAMGKIKYLKINTLPRLQLLHVQQSREWKCWTTSWVDTLTFGGTSKWQCFVTSIVAVGSALFL